MMKLVLKVTRPSACLKETGKGEIVEETKIFDIENKEAEQFIKDSEVEK